MIRLDPKVRFIISVPDWQPEEATPFQGFALSLCLNSRVLGFINQMPSDIFELTPEVLPYRIPRRIAGQASINWYGQSPRALKSRPFPIEASFTIILLDRSEAVADYAEWLANSPGPVTLVAEKDGQIDYSMLSYEAVQTRFLEICGLLREIGTVENVDDAQAAIASWVQPAERHLPFNVGGHGTIFPNAAALRVCGFVEVGKEPFSRLGEGEKAHIEQIVLTADAVFGEREANPPSAANQIYPRTPDLNLYLPATYDLNSAISLRAGVDRKLRDELKTALRLLDRQPSYSFEISSPAKMRALLGITAEALQEGESPPGNPIMSIRQRELWLGTEAVACLAASEIGAVVRLPNRLNLARSLVRQFAQHYRAERPPASEAGGALSWGAACDCGRLPAGATRFDRSIARRHPHHR